MNKNNTFRGSMALAIVSAFLLSGCGSGDKVADVVGNINTNNVMRVASCYAFFQMKNKFKGPKNLKEFKAFMSQPEIATNLEMMGIDPDDIDSVFISERDDEEIVIRWNVPGSARGCYEPVAFEKTGVDGSRRVGFANGVFEDVDSDGTYQDMLAGKVSGGEGRKESAAPKIDKNGNQVN